MYENYYLQVEDSVKDYIEDNAIDIETVDYETLLCDMMLSDGVTGDGSGSYFFNTYKARECVIENLDEVREALNEYCYTYEQIGEMFMEDEWETMDVIARCYQLNWALANYYEEHGVSCC